MSLTVHDLRDRERNERQLAEMREIETALHLLPSDQFPLVNRVLLSRANELFHAHTLSAAARDTEAIHRRIVIMQEVID